MYNSQAPFTHKRDPQLLAGLLLVMTHHEPVFHVLCNYLGNQFLSLPKKRTHCPDSELASLSSPLIRMSKCVPSQMSPTYGVVGHPHTEASSCWDYLNFIMIRSFIEITLVMSSTKQNRALVHALQELTSTINLENFPSLTSLSLMLNSQNNHQHSIVVFRQNTLSRQFSTLSRNMKVILNHYMVVRNIR